jgi:hypothetical protein
MRCAFPHCIDAAIKILRLTIARRPLRSAFFTKIISMLKCSRFPLFAAILVKASATL